MSAASTDDPPKPAGGAESYAELLPICRRPPATDPRPQTLNPTLAASSSSSATSASDSSSDSDDEACSTSSLEDATAVPLFAPPPGRPRRWPDAGVSDLLVQAACCPLDVSLEPALEALLAAAPGPGGAGGADGAALPACTCGTRGPALAEACVSDGGARGVTGKATGTAAGRGEGHCPSCGVLPAPGGRPRPLGAPLLLLGYKGEWLEAAGGLLPLWEKSPLEPYAGRKAVLYYLLAPRADLPAAAAFLKDLGTMYAAAGLGSHAPASPAFHAEGAIGLACGPGEGEGEGEGPFLAALADGCDALAESLAVSPPGPTAAYAGASLDANWDAAVVVYVALPAGSPGLPAAALLEAAARLAPGASPPHHQGAHSAMRPPLPGGAAPADAASRRDVTLQVVSRGAMGDLSGAALRSLAFSVYSKIRRQPFAPGRSAASAPPPPTPPMIMSPMELPGPLPSPCGPGPGQTLGAASPDLPEDGGLGSLCSQVVPSLAEGGEGAEGEPAGGRQGGSGGAVPSSSLLHEPLFVLPRAPARPGAEAAAVVASSNGGSGSGICEALALHCAYVLLAESLRVAARAAAAAGSRARLRRMVLTRLGPPPAAELAAWDSTLRAYIGAGAGPASGGASCLESIALLSLAAEPPAPLAACAWDLPTGAFLLQPGGGAASVVWLPAADPGAMLLPGEAGTVRALHLDLLLHHSLHDAASSTSPAMPATPATPTGSAPSAEPTVDEAAQRQTHAAQAATELHHLACLNAAFSGLCLFQPATASGMGLGALGRAGPRAHLPLHCGVAQRLWALAYAAEEWSSA
eukprot:jgi/Tetstr1/423255/TSEL_013955.t1